MSVPRPEVRLTLRAEQDYEDITLYTRRTWGERQKITYRKAIGQALRRLRDHPELGRSEDEHFLGCRALRVEQHDIYYHQPRPEEIVVVRILHIRQDATGKVRL
jgi:plasmid stabilization system protein ParE